MIHSFRHKGLRRLYTEADPKGVRPDHRSKLVRILDLLDAAQKPSDLDLPGLRLHPLKGSREGEWAVSVSGNWRVTFPFADGEALDVDYIDYH